MNSICVIDYMVSQVSLPIWQQIKKTIDKLCYFLWPIYGILSNENNEINVNLYFNCLQLEYTYFPGATNICKKLVEAGFIYVFNMGFPASLFRINLQ